MKVVLAQLAPVPADPEANVDRLCAVLAERQDAALAVFPELFVTGYALDDLDDVAGAVDAPALTRVARAAAGASTAVVVGFAERMPDGRIANAAACFDASGRVAGVYRKTHLFGPAEEAAFTAGEQLVLARLAGHVVAPLICYDIEFPEPARAVARAGAELLVTVSANMIPYAPEHALASRARALDNRRPHVYVNRVGQEYGLDFVGGSQAVGRDGVVLAAAGEAEEVLEVDIPVGGIGDDPAVEYLDHARGELAVAGPA